MKRTILIAAALFAATTRAAIPSLTDLANSLASLTTRFTDTTNRVASLSARFDEATNNVAVLSARLETITNRTARIEAAINSNETMRRAFHGGNPLIHYATNEVTRIIQRVHVYPDGYEHIDTGYVRRALTPEEAAVLAAKRLGSREERIERLRQRIQEELAMGSTPATNDATIAATALARIRAARYQTQLDRLLSSGTTNTVDVVVTPQTPNP